MLRLFQNLGTPSNSAIHKYVNAKKVPHLFVATGATKWGDPENFPWTIGFQPSYQIESQIYAKYILKNKPAAKIAVLYQNDDYGKDYLKGLKDGLGDKAGMIVAEASYEVSDPTVDSQIVTLKSSGADAMFIIATPKFAAQAIRKVVRHRLEAAALRQQRGVFDRRRTDACGTGQVHWPDHRALPEGSTRPAMGEGCRHAALARIHEQVHARGRPGGLQLCLRLWRGTAHGSCNQGVRR